jgi:polar amino acid transport system substrate-binding protein
MYIFILKKQVKSRTRELELLAKTDNLTKCNNRQSIDEIFAKEIFRRKRYSNPLSIILIDIDDFKKINDTFGHLVGDKTIILIAELLKNNIRQSDSLGRWGGEEFLIICPETNLSEAEVLANKLCQQIGLLDFPHEEQCTASFGVTTSRKKDKEEDAFIRADKALYLAKEEGKNRVKSL